MISIIVLLVIVAGFQIAMFFFIKDQAEKIVLHINFYHKTVSGLERNIEMLLNEKQIKETKGEKFRAIKVEDYEDNNKAG